MPVSPIPPVPSARGQSHDGSGGDATGFGSLLGGLDADAEDGGTAGQASSGASGPPVQHGGAPPAAEGSAAASPNGPGKSDKGAAPSADAEPAKAAGPAKDAAQAKGGAGHLELAGKGAAHAKSGKLAAKDDKAVADPNAAAASATLLAPAAAVTDQAVPAAGAVAAGVEAASIPVAAPVAALPAAASAPATDGPVAAADALQTIASALTADPTAGQPDAPPAASAPPIDAAASPAPALPAVDAAPLAAPSAFSNAVLEATLQVSPLTGNATTPDATAPGIAASLLAGVKPSSGGGAPAAALSPTGPGPQASAAPAVSAAPAAAAAPQASIAPAIAAAISLISEVAGDADRIVIRALPRGIDSADLHNGRAAAGLPAGGAPAASFGNALFPGGIPALAAALLGNTEDQTSDLADGLLQSGKHELTPEAGGDKAAGESGVSEALTASSHEPGLPAPSFAAALAHTQSTGSSGGTESARPAQHPAMPPMPALQIMPSLTKAAGDGGGRFNIQLHPQELGRVRVELDIDHDGHVTAAISAAHPATLDLLRRDAAALQQALNDAGLKTDGNALSFNLQGNGQDMGDGSGRSSRSGAPVVPPAVDPLEDAAPKTGTVSLGAGLVAVDIRI